MGITTEQYERMIRFLDADMEEAEMDAFEKELDSNPEMRKQLDFEQSVRDEFMLRGIDRLPGTVATNENLPAPAAPGKVIHIQKWIAIGAAVVTVITFLTIFWQKPGKNPGVADRKNMEVIDTVQQNVIPPGATVAESVKESSKKVDLALLFKQYFKKDALPEQYPLFLAEALMDYESGNYTTLQKLNLNNLPQTRSAGETDRKENILQLGHYYKGLAFLQAGNTRDAFTNLHWVLNNQPDKPLQAKAQWYLALAYLKENNSKKAAGLCRQIVNDKENHILVKNAEKILDALEK